MAKKIGLVGAGQIGGVLALVLQERNLGEVVLLDIVPDMPQGKALDCAEGAPAAKSNFMPTGTNDWADLKGCDIVVITSGKPRAPGMSRDDLVGANKEIIKIVAEKFKEACPDALALLVANPLDVMVTQFQKITGKPHSEVFGMAGILDSSRFKSFIAMELGVSPLDVNAVVMGGHGDTMVPLERLANVCGVPVTELIEKDKLDAIIKRVKGAGGEIVKLYGNNIKGSAFYSTACCIAEMVEAVMIDSKRVIPSCCYCKGEFGIDGYYMGVPAVIGAGGVEKIIEVKLNDEEKAQVAHSVDAVKDVLKVAGLD